MYNLTQNPINSQICNLFCICIIVQSFAAVLYYIYVCVYMYICIFNFCFVSLFSVSFFQYLSIAIIVHSLQYLIYLWLLIWNLIWMQKGQKQVLKFKKKIMEISIGLDNINTSYFIGIHIWFWIDFIFYFLLLLIRLIVESINSYFALDSEAFIFKQKR